MARSRKASEAMLQTTLPEFTAPARFTARLVVSV